MSETRKQRPFNNTMKKSIVRFIKKGFVIQSQDKPIEEYAVFDITTKQQILKLRENYATVSSSIRFQDKFYMTKDAYYIVDGVKHLMKDAQLPDDAHYIKESDYRDIYELIKSVSVKVR